MAIENANVGLEAMKAMKSGASAMKQIHGAMSVDDVDRTMDDIRDQMDVANEISEAISTPIAPGLDFDEDELAAELDALESEGLGSELSATPSASKAPPAPAPPVNLDHLPAAPTGQPTAEEEEELRALQADLAM